METSKNNKVEKRTYDVVNDDDDDDDDDTQHHLAQSKKPKLPGLARYCIHYFYVV
jgi:hypothetical protein